MKRIALVLALIGLVVVAGASSTAARPTVETFPVDFTITSEMCSNLPDGTTIEGSGTMKSITTDLTKASGVTTVMNASHAHGTATDQDGNTYVFDYSNEFRASSTIAEPDLL